MKLKFIAVAFFCIGYSQKILEQIMTPETVQTRSGTLKFMDEVPTAGTSKSLYGPVGRCLGPSD